MTKTPAFTCYSLLIKKQNKNPIGKLLINFDSIFYPRILSETLSIILMPSDT